MAPLTTNIGDDVMETSLLRPVEEESRPSPTLEEEIALLGKGDGPPGDQALLPNKQAILVL